MDKIQSIFCQLLQEKGIICSKDKINKFELYYQKLVLWNEKVNLTGITDREQIYIKHFFDSLSLAFYLPMESITNMADIGSGAGFPSIPLKIIFPHLSITIVDSLNKRITFLNQLIQLLELDKVVCIHGRAEDLARNKLYRDQFDLVTARAVARLNVLNELCLPFVKKNGKFVAMKGNDPSDEIIEAVSSFKELKAELTQINSFLLPVEFSQRNLLVISKRDHTPVKFPRKAGLPFKIPLV